MQICSWKLHSWAKFNDTVTTPSSSRAVVKREVYLAYGVATASTLSCTHARIDYTGARFALIAIQFVINSVHRNVEGKARIAAPRDSLALI